MSLASHIVLDVESGSTVSFLMDSPDGGRSDACLAVANLDAHNGTDTTATTVGMTGDRSQKMRLVSNDAGDKHALQNLRGGYLACRKCADRIDGAAAAERPDTAEAHSGGMLQFRSEKEYFEFVVPPAAQPSWLTDRVAIRVCSAGPYAGKYIAPGALLDSACVLADAPHFWRLRLSDVPVIDVSALRGRGAEQLSMAPDAESLPPAQFALVCKLTRAHMEAGACQAVLHGVSRDLFSYLCMRLGDLPYDADSASKPLKERKLKFGLLQERRGKLSSGERLGAASIQQLARVYMDEMTRCTEPYLHALALGQQLVQQRPVLWRQRLCSDRVLGLHVLQYPPGPAGVLTTEKHADRKTLLTVLDQDSCGGLFLEPVSLHRHAQLRLRAPIDAFALQPYSGALLVNSGSVLEAVSEGFYRAGLHWVERSADCAQRTRISLPFFYGGAKSHASGSPK